MALTTPNGKAIDSYYNKYDEKKRYQEVLLRAGYPTQANEINELQSILFERIKRIADGIFSDGDIVSDAQVAVNETSGEVQAQAGAIYIDGTVWPVDAASFSIPTVGSVAIGIRLVESIISELEDPDLYNPAIGSRSEGEPGAWRRRVEARWGFDGDGGGGNFYPVHTVDDGIVRAKDAPPALDSILQAIARYDRDSTAGGTYVCNGMHVAAAENNAAGRQVYTVSDGRCRVGGIGVELLTSRRLAYDAVPDLRNVSMEVVLATGGESQRINVAHTPLDSITSLHVPLAHTETVTHGNYSGCRDPLAKTGILKVLQVRRGDTQYVEGEDFRRTGDTIDWSPAGNEPATGETYDVMYVYLEQDFEPEDVDFDGFSVRGAVEGQNIIVSYNQALPRIDRLCIDAEGVFTWLQGVPAEYNAKAPGVPGGLLSLATVAQNWRTLAERTVNSNGTRVVPFEEFKALADRVDHVLQEVARNRLETDVATREAGARVGLFVDPLLDDSMRDQGLEQTAAVVNGMLTLPVAADAHGLSADIARPRARAFTPKVALEQPLRTGSMLVNPYQSFEPVPANVSLTPAVDRWTEKATAWASGVTQVFNNTIYAPGHPQHGQTIQSTGTSTQVLGTASSTLEYLRQIDVAFVIDGFGPGEQLNGILFDGISVNAREGALAANDQGRLSGTFTIPAKVSAGTKLVEFRGAANGATARATFVGQGTLETTTLRQVQTVTNTYVDPLAQTFTCDADLQLAGVDLFFTAKGASPAHVQIRETDNGHPTRVVLVDAEIRPENMVVTGNGHTRVLFDAPCPLSAGVEYALVILTDDPATALAIAEMGKFDTIHQQWVSSQAYTIGVLLSSSNASTWTAHQDKDLTFRLLSAAFTDGAATVDLGQTASVDGITDLLLYAAAETPSAQTRVEYELTLPDSTVMTVAAEQVVRLATPVSGAMGIKARLTGTSQSSPVLWPGTQLVTGTIGSEGTYFTRSVKATGAVKAVVVLDAYVPGGSSCLVELQKDSGEFEAMPQTAAVPQGDGIVEFTYSVELAAIDLVKGKITLAGSATARPYVQNIRLMAVA